MNEISSCNALWRRFCGKSWVLKEGETWKMKYMSWLQPKLRNYSSYKGRKNTVMVAGAVVLKVTLVGDEGVGKSSFMRRYHKDEFNVVYRATIGLDFCSQITDLQGQQVKLQLWDTAGRPRYRSHTTAPYRMVSGVILMYDTTNRASFESVQGRWMPEITGNVDEPNIMLLGAKKDLTELRQVTRDEGMELAQEIGATGWAEYSSATGSQEEAEELLRRVAVTALTRQCPFWPTDGCYVPHDDLLQSILAKQRPSP